MIKKIKNYVRYFLLKNGFSINRFKIEKYLYPNVFNTSYNKNVLVCHFTATFKYGIKLSHTAYAECWEICNAFKELGYNVDVVNYDRWLAPNEIEITKYDLFFGQGDSFESIFYYDKENRPKIQYSTGLSTKYLNDNAIERIRQFKYRHNEFLFTSSVFAYQKVLLQLAFSDKILVWGNDFCIKTYIDDFQRNEKDFVKLPAFFYKTNFDIKILSNKSFLWFGGNLMLHRGLDIVLDFFIINTQYKLHLCGNMMNDKDFFEFYKTKITDNIIVHGFVDVNSIKFKQILEDCSFVLYLSAGEGTSASLITVIGNGGLLPIITEECCFDFPEYGLLVNDINLENIKTDIDKLYNQANDKLVSQKNKLKALVNEKYNVSNYKFHLLNALKEFL